MKKKLITAVAMALTLLMLLSIPAAAYQPMYDGMEDIRWFGGYDPASGLSVMTDVDKGVHVVLKKGPEMWANRVVAGWDYDLSENDSKKYGIKPSEDGIYVHLEDIVWDTPKPTPALKEPYASVMITIAATQGGWSDGRALMFWIRKSYEGKCVLAVLRGQDANESVDQFAMNYVELKEDITDEINFWFRRTDANTWTLNLNNNVFTFDDKTVVSERFIDMNPLAVSLGTWNSACGVEFTVSDLWSYGCIEYDVKNPPAFVKSVRAKESASNTTTKKPDATTTQKADTNTTASTNAANSTTVNDNTTTGTEANTTSSEVSTTTGSNVDSGDGTTTTTADSTVPTDPVDNDPQEKDGGWLVWLIVGLIAVVAIGGGAGFYFMFVRKPKEQ